MYNLYGEVSSQEYWYGSEMLFSSEYDDANNHPIDQLGRITGITEEIYNPFTGDVDHNIRYQYIYDDSDRLQYVYKNGVLQSSYEYDNNDAGNGNRTKYENHITDEVVEDIIYDEQDRLIRYGDVSFEYTHNGDLLSRTQAGQTTYYHYDELGNLMSVEKADGSEIEYIVDGWGRRVGKRVNGEMVQGFLYKDSINPIAELNGSNQVVSVFVYATRSNVPDYMMSRKGTLNWRVYRIISDHLGSPRLVVDADSGVVVQRMDYDEFGNLDHSTIFNPDFQPFGFAGGIYDGETGLVKFGDRDYDPTIGRFTTKNPVVFYGGDFNLYAYVSNDPINFIDPTGLDKKKPWHFGPEPWNEQDCKDWREEEENKEKKGKKSDKKYFDNKYSWCHEVTKNWDQWKKTEIGKIISKSCAIWNVSIDYDKWKTDEEKIKASDKKRRENWDDFYKWKVNDMWMKAWKKITL